MLANRVRFRLFFVIARPKLFFSFLIFLYLGPLAHFCQATDDSAWRYDLRPGDHLVYHFTFERTYRGDDGLSRTRAEYTNHVLVLGRREEHVSIGFQRNRESAELLAYREHGKDKLVDELPKFRDRMSKRPSHFSEAMEFNALGEPLAQWEAVRETASKLILGVHELEALPQRSPKSGESWRGSNLLGITFTLAARETVGNKDCNRVDGVDPSGGVHLRYWWCDGSRVIERINFDGEYSVPGGNVSETARFELKEKWRDESLAKWLDAPDSRDAALQSLLLSPWIGINNEMLEPALKSRDARTQALVLTYLYQSHQSPFNAGTIAALVTNTDPTVKRLAILLAAQDTASGIDPPQTCLLKWPVFPTQKIGTTVRLLSDPQFGTHTYMMRVPGDYRMNRKLPLLVYLSGGGGLAIDGVNTADDVISETDFLVLYPQAGDYWWQPNIRARVDTLLTHVLHEFNVDTNRIYIAGFSNGGTGALDYAQLSPHRFAGAVSLMGAGQCNPQVAGGLKNLNLLPILLVHGERDPRIEVGCSKDTFEGLKRLNPKVEPILHVLEKREHDITLQQDGGFTRAFLADKIRDPFPKKIAVTWDDLAFPRRYWVEVLEKGSGTAEVQASIMSDNRIEITVHGVKRLRLLLRHELVSPDSPLAVIVNKKKVFEGFLASDCSTLAESSWRLGDPLLGYERAIDIPIGK